MHVDLAQLPLLFDHFPDIVLFVKNRNIVYTNQAAQKRLPEDPSALLPFFAMLPESGGDVFVTLAEGPFHVTATLVDGGQLLILRSIATDASMPAIAKVPALLRGHLNGLLATTEQLSQQIAALPGCESYRKLLAMQTQASYRILRLTRQLELAQDGWEMDYPLAPLNFTDLCQHLFEELDSHLPQLGPLLHYQMEPTFLFVSANRNLLEQMILSLLSNAIKSAGNEGRIEIALKQQDKRALLSIWDSGPHIPDERMAMLFSPQTAKGLPLPTEGTGLDLWIAQRIALFHGGVIMAGNREKGGTEFSLSLPINLPQQLRLDSPAPPVGTPSDFSPMLIALADALPRSAFFPHAE